jgi:hypothetical protein
MNKENPRKEYQKAWREANKLKIKEQKRLKYLENQDQIKNYQKVYQANNKEKILKRQKEKRDTDPLFKLKVNLRNAINLSITKSGFKKLSRTEEILGCTFEDFKSYLESKFESWMTWENRGLYNGTFNYGWDIDHIIPLTTGKNYFEIISLNHYTNLQPLCSHYNRDVKRDCLPE